MGAAKVALIMKVKRLESGVQDAIALGAKNLFLLYRRSRLVSEQKQRLDFQISNAKQAHRRYPVNAETYSRTYSLIHNQHSKEPCLTFSHTQKYRSIAVSSRPLHDTLGLKLYSNLGCAHHSDTANRASSFYVLNDQLGRSRSKYTQS